MTSAERLRQHPEERLASPVQVFDVATVVESLRNEAHDARNGHRQVTIGRHGPVTQIIMTFEDGGLFKEHTAEGVVTIQVLGGKLEVVLEAETLELVSGQLVTLAPGVPHSVRALAESEMLLSIAVMKDEPLG